MQFIVGLGLGGAVEIKCPVCDSLLETTREQDWRVHIMQHPVTECPWSKKTFRVDRLTGYAEFWPEKEAPCEPTEGETRTSTTISAPSPPTVITNAIRPTRRVIPGVVHGRIRR